MTYTYKEYVDKYYTYLLDLNFCMQLDRLPIKEQLVRLQILNHDDCLTEQTLEGYVTSGNLNVNGNSTLRRTGSLQMVADETNREILKPENIISIKTRFALEVGFKNTLSLTYTYNDSSMCPDVFWFPLGVFIATSCSITRNDAGLNISLSFKDKMVLLNGELGGKFPAEVRLDKADKWEEEDEKWVTITPTLKDIICSIIPTYGHINIDESKITIPELADKVLAWYGKRTVYLVEVIDQEGNIVYANIVLTNAEAEEIKASVEEDDYTTSVTSINYGDHLGYEKTDFTYPAKQDLIAEAGSTITSVLDKIIGLVNNYTYYFDVYGDFHFTEKKGVFYDNNNIGESAYDFSDDILVSAFVNNPQYLQIKNDFVVLGERTSQDVKRIIRYHFLFASSKPDVEGAEENTEVTVVSDNSGRKVLVRTESTESAGFTPQHYLEAMYLDVIIYDNSQWAPYKEELCTFVPKLVDLGLDDATRKEVWQALDNDHSDKDWWFDIYKTNGFLSANEDISSLDIEDINRRPTVLKANGVNCLMENEVPPYTLIEAGSTANAVDGTISLNVSANLMKGIAQGGAKFGAAEYLRSILYQHISYNESITLTTIPIYHLLPNSIIEVKDEDTSISGYYVINSFSVPLSVEGTMSIQCGKALQMLAET